MASPAARRWRQDIDAGAVEVSEAGKVLVMLFDRDSTTTRDTVDVSARLHTFESSALRELGDALYEAADEADQAQQDWLQKHDTGPDSDQDT